MTVACPDCQSVFRIDPAKVPATGVRARCSVCGGIIAIASGAAPATARSLTPSATATFGAQQASAPQASTATRAPAPARPTPRAFTPLSVTSLPSAPAPAPASPTPVASTPVGSSPVGSTPLRVPAVTPHMACAVTPHMAPAVTPRGTPADSRAVGQGTPAEGKRPINPFLRTDPAHHPQKREDGLRDGTLRQLFREEIKKSYEEYVEQVGREGAESAPHFQDALNDILAGGRRLF